MRLHGRQVEALQQAPGAEISGPLAIYVRPSLAECWLVPRLADFTARYTRDGLGLYKTVSRGEPYLATQFEDTHARKVFPCWDEPSFKINWQLTLTVPETLEAVVEVPFRVAMLGGKVPVTLDARFVVAAVAAAP